jgi:hypothetical protein
MLHLVVTSLQLSIFDFFSFITEYSISCLMSYFPVEVT